MSGETLDLERQDSAEGLRGKRIPARRGSAEPSSAVALGSDSLRDKPGPILTNASAHTHARTRRHTCVTPVG